MSYIYLLDGIEFDAPVNDTELLTTIKRNSNLDGFLITQDADLTFAGNAYTYITDKFYDDTYCSEIEIEILEECDGGIEEIYTGIIKLSSIVIDEDECTVRVKVQDNSFYSYINNNKSMDISPTQTGTKNGTEIPSCLQYDIQVFDPSTGTYSPDLRKAYRVYDLLEHAVTVMTDGRVGFRSDYLWNQDDEMFLTTGNALAVPGNPASFVYSFDKLYSELNKIFNLSFFIEEDLYQTPTLRIEDKNYFYSFSDGITFSDIKELKVSADQSKIYGTVTLGSSKILDAPAYINFNESLPFYGFKQEKFYPLGQCNLDTELNLVNDYVLSSNIIEDCVMNSSEDYYDEIIFLNCENIGIAGTADAIRHELNGSAPPYIYNLNCNNYNKAQRYYGYLPANLLDAFNINNQDFRAEHASQTPYYIGAGGVGTPIPIISYPFCYLDIEPFQFPDESSAGNYDLGGNYNNVTDRYTVPSNGTYTISASIYADIIKANVLNTSPSVLICQLQRYNSSNVLVEQSAAAIANIPDVNTTPLSISAEATGVFDCVAGDYIQVKVTWSIYVGQLPIANMFQAVVRQTSFFMSSSDNLISANTPSDYKIIRYEFQYPLSKADFNTLKADPTGLQTFTKWSEAQQAFRTRRAWIEEIKYNNWEQFASVKLIANNAIIQE